LTNGDNDDFLPDVGLNPIEGSIEDFRRLLRGGH
jgi:hypothetical protein